MGKVAAILGLLVASLAVLVLSDRSLPPAELTVINRSEFNTLDPQRMSYLHDLRLAYSIYEPLVRWDNESPDFAIVPAAAERWEAHDDGRTYTFFLREDARWSNGEPVTAHDFVYSWRRGMLPDTVADYSSFFMHIDGAQAFFDHRTRKLETYAELEPWRKAARYGGDADVDSAESFAALPGAAQRDLLQRAAENLYQESLDFFAENVGLEAVDDTTLRVRTAKRIAYFLDLAAFGVYCPVNPDLVNSYRRINPDSGRIEQSFDWTKPPKLVTNGPYVPVAWRFKREMFLEENPHYWNKPAVKSKTVKIIPINDPNTSVLAFETGAANWNSDVTVDYVADMLEAKDRGEYEWIHAFSTFGTYFWSFNCTPTLAGGQPNPFHDAAVRRAFTLAVDKREIAENVKRSGEKPARVFVPPGSIPGFDNPEGLPFDPTRARAELRAAGWFDRDGDGVPDNASGTPFPVVEMLYSTGSYHDDIALAMGSMWEEHLGVKVRLIAKELKIYKDNLKSQNYMVARGGWFGDYGDPTTFLDLHRTGDGNNDRGYSDPDFDRMMDAAALEQNPEERMRLLAEAERYTMEETLPILPIWHYNYYYLYKPPYDAEGRPQVGGLRGISDHPRLVQYLWKLDVIDEAEAAAMPPRSPRDADEPSPAMPVRTGAAPRPAPPAADEGAAS